VLRAGSRTEWSVRRVGTGALRRLPSDAQSAAALPNAPGVLEDLLRMSNVTVAVRRVARAWLRILEDPSSRIPLFP
jgi:hypothetical protein